VRLVISVIIAAITAAMFTLPLSVTSTAAAQARTMRIMYSPGGEVDAFIGKFNKARRDNTLVIIDGQCISACTLRVRPDQARAYLRHTVRSARLPQRVGTRTTKVRSSSPRTPPTSSITATRCSSASSFTRRAGTAVSIVS
jgi:hypothetical protein